MLPVSESVSCCVCVCSDSGHHVPSSVTGQLSTVSTATSHDQAAMTNWLWQYTAAAAASGSTTDQFVAGTDSLQPNAVDAMTNGSVILYQMADGTQSAAYAANSVPGSGDMLEPGEVRLPPVTAAQTNGIAAGDQLYSNSAAGVGVDYQPSGVMPWLRQTVGGSTTMDSEKQLLRGALVDKVREIQRLTRELEQAYALIHQLKQHSEFLHRQWGQMHVASDTPQ